MKVIHIIDSGGIYGAEVVLLNLMQEQIKFGISPVLFSIGESPSEIKPIEAEAKDRFIQVEKIRIKKGLNILGGIKIIKTARKYGGNLLHCHGYKANILMGIMPSAVRKIPVISTLHGWTTSSVFSKKMCIELLDAAMLKKNDKCVVVAKSMLKNPVIRAFRVKPFIVNNGIPLQDFNMNVIKKAEADLYKKCKNSFTIGSIGRLSPEKGFEDLIEAFIYIKKSRGIDGNLLIIGDGKEREKLKHLITINNMEDDILLPGYIGNASKLLPLFNIFVLPSYTEGLPITLLEAMQAQVPCIAANVGDVPEVLDFGKCGSLFFPGDRKALIRELISLIASEQLRMAYAVAARKRAITNYSVNTMVKKYYEIYKMIEYR